MKIRKILVTGGAGFIGSHLVDRLLRDKHKVLVLDNFSTGRLDNLKQHKGNKNLVIRKIDIGGKELHKYFKDIDWVFHLAALADIVPSIVRPLDYHHSNVDGTVNVLEGSRKAKVIRFIYAASSSCYGIPDVYPTPEEAPKKGPVEAPIHRLEEQPEKTKKEEFKTIAIQEGGSGTTANAPVSSAQAESFRKMADAERERARKDEEESKIKEKAKEAVKSYVEEVKTVTGFLKDWAGVGSEEAEKDKKKKK